MLGRKRHEKEGEELVREDVWTDMYESATLGAPEDRDVAGFRLGRRWLGQGPY